MPKKVKTDVVAELLEPEARRNLDLADNCLDCEDAELLLKDTERSAILGRSDATLDPEHSLRLSPQVSRKKFRSTRNI